jgi:NAD-dependent SIR2 family protein deacetylase
MLIVEHGYRYITGGGCMPRCPSCGYKMPTKYIEECLEERGCIRCPRCKAEYLDLDELDYD